MHLIICTHEWIKGEFFVHTKALNIHGYRLFSHVVYAAMLSFHPPFISKTMQLQPLPLH